MPSTEQLTCLRMTDELEIASGYRQTQAAPQEHFRRQANADTPCTRQHAGAELLAQVGDVVTHALHLLVLTVERGAKRLPKLALHRQTHDGFLPEETPSHVPTQHPRPPLCICAGLVPCQISTSAPVSAPNSQPNHCRPQYGGNCLHDPIKHLRGERK